MRQPQPLIASGESVLVRTGPQNRANENGEALANHLPGAVKAAPPGRRAFDEEGGGAGKFSAGGETLQQPRHHNDQRRADADGSVSRRKCDQRNGDRHRGDDNKQRGFAAAAIGVNAEKNASDRPHEKADAERRGGEEQRRVLTFAREKQARNNDGEKAEDNEVVPLECVADNGRGELVRFWRRLRKRHGRPPIQGKRELKGAEDSISASQHVIPRGGCGDAPFIDNRGTPAYLIAAQAQVAELVDALVSGTSAARRGGSSPLLGTS